MSDIIVKHTSVVITDYSLGDCVYVERLLSTWDKLYHRHIPYYIYDKNKREMRLPRGIDIIKLQKIYGKSAILDKDCDPYQEVSFKLKVPPRDNIQKKAISFLLGKGDFEYTLPHSQLSLNLNTGDGKTYCCIAAMTMLGMRTIIVTHKDSIKEQWLKSLITFTTLDDSLICNLDSSSKMTRYKEKSRIKEKVFLINHRSLHSYAKKYGWEGLTEFFEDMKFGLKIYDEAHKEFTNILRVDAYTNTKKTFYVTANFGQSDKDKERIFSNAFSNVMKFGVETLIGKKRHIVYMPYFFNSYPEPEEIVKIRGAVGFNRNAYCDYQVKNGLIFEVCTKLLMSYMKKQPYKVLVLFSKINAVDEYYKYLSDIVTDKRIIEIHSNVPDEDKLLMRESDIIISTPMSIGTGDDIKGLGCVIMTEPYSSKITANQVSGRLRDLGNDEECFYIEPIDMGFQYTVKMYKERLRFFKKKCKKVIEIDEAKK